MQFTILGSGLFATALAEILTNNNHKVLMWSIVEEQVNSINNHHINYMIPYSQKLNNNIKATLSLEEALSYSNIYILAVPSYVVGDVIKKIKPLLNSKNKYIFINVAKGLYPPSGDFINNYLIQNIPSKYVKFIGSIIGPSFAIEVLNKEITHVDLIGTNPKYFDEIISWFSKNTFLVHPNPYLKEAEFLSCYKNVMALLAGIIHGYNFQFNTHAAFMTQVINEEKYILKELNWNSNAIFYYSGIGDLILTCSTKKSRNFNAGIKIASLNSVNDVLLNFTKLNITIEGIGNTLILKKFFQKNNIDWEKIPLFSSAITMLTNYKIPLRTLFIKTLKNLKTFKT